MNDTEKVRLLLLSRNDYLGSPRISRVYRAALPGPQASAYVPCDNCQSTGHVKNRQPCQLCLDGRTDRPHGHMLCSACDGRGERKRRRGEPHHDMYSNMPLDEAVRAREDDLLKHAPRRRWTDGPDLSEDPVWRRKQAQEATGSYAELDKQLAWLQLAHQPRFELLAHWLDSQAQDGLWWAWSARAEQAVHDTIVLVARRMRKPIRVPNWACASLRIAKKAA